MWPTGCSLNGPDVDFSKRKRIQVNICRHVYYLYTDPDLKVEVIWTSTGGTLVCQSSCPFSDRYSFYWYKNNRPIYRETSPVLKGHAFSEGRYSCGFESYHSREVCEFTTLHHPLCVSYTETSNLTSVMFMFSRCSENSHSESQ